MISKNLKANVSVIGASLAVLTGLALMAFSFVSDNSCEITEKPSIAPVNLAKAKVGDGYGYRIHPATKENKLHRGIDFILAEGEPVTATADGVVVNVVNDEYRGIYVTIKHDDVYSTSYSHLKSAVVKVRDRIKQKQLIGYVGSTGKVSSGPHLHYEVLKDGKNVDPADYLPGSIGTRLPPKSK
jgi:murein DD-endopeptidase MepM/ murein hydrolase activator NlpD